MTRRMQSLLSAVLVGLNASFAFGQQWSGEVQTGRIRSSLDPTADPAYSVAAGLRYESSAAQFRINGGVPTSSEQPYWAAVAGAKRFALHSGPVVAGIDLGGHGFLSQDRNQRTGGLPLPGSPPATPDLSGHAFAGQALPLLGLELKNIQMYARAGFAHYESEFASQQRSRNAGLGDVQLNISPTPEVAFVPTLKHVRTSDSAYTYAGLTAMVGGPRAVLWGNAGQWLSLDKEATGWAVGTTLRAHDRISFNANVRHDGFDPLYLTASQTAWNVGLSIQFSRSSPRAPIPASYANGRATIRLKRGATKTQPSIAGDFNAWKPQPMQLTDDGWVYAVAVAPGVYNYSFVNEQGEWFVPDKYPGRKDDGMGGFVAVLVVQR